LTHQIIDEIDLCAAHIVDRDGIDHNRCPVARQDKIIGFTFAANVEDIRESGASAALDADAQRRFGGFRRENRRNALRCAIRQGDVRWLLHLVRRPTRGTGLVRFDFQRKGEPDEVQPRAKAQTGVTDTYQPIALLAKWRPVTLRPGERWSAPYAADPWKSRGRLYAEPPSATRTEFQRDRDRIVHSTAFRRLKHKTQVFLEHEGDHYRTRLTHSLEVAQIARSIARALGLDEDLAETLALAHDLGHTPFGHAGERALQRANASCGGFDHNAQSLRIVTLLESRYAGFDGLNLSWEALEGLVKHNGPLTDRAGVPVGETASNALFGAISTYNELHDLQLWSQASAEAQAAAIADDIAYNAHDIDDGLRAGLLTLELLREAPFLAEMIDAIRSQHVSIEIPRLTHELQRRIITAFVEDVICESARRLAALAPADCGAIRAAAYPVVAFSQGMREHERAIRKVLFANVYRNARVMGIMSNAERVVEDIYAALSQDPSKLPDGWMRVSEGRDTADPAQRIVDFIAGMTDRYAIDMHRRLFDATPDLR
jgi:dGTPase